ncbi:uncharacterized protein BBOV_IV001180 [Babesia bovis T2Bo]|uniref:Uncharacterized protein n=1 Tax=Babesia bovis TaxID=5865 RepID=A7AV89_BABBO|nr:uncharacterized protein BBOV_IV001180 [Babesia bovis T2Bo]EDO05715.1 hypothetical protein BBOV_IV001180 [Babesia bovis T2Bo]|eukprot:XP_001609283.1 hypothetical protein [Babesia bovis T2Bo]
MIVKLRSLFIVSLVAAFIGEHIINTEAFLGINFGKGGDSVSLFFHSIPYFFRKIGCSPWVRCATNDDIRENKYVFVDLFSRSHHHAIKLVHEEDDTVNRRSSIITYTINHDDLPGHFQGVTFGDVYYYHQMLQEEGDYDVRHLMTYRDELNRFCVYIESFDETGNRHSMRLYREKRRAWWLKEVASEGNVMTETWNEFLSYFGYATDKPQIQHKLNIKESNCPQGMVNHKSSTYDLIYNTNPGGGLKFIGEVVFRSMPLAIADTVTDLYVWRYFKGERDNITYVVVAEIYYWYSHLTYFRCTSPKDAQYEEVDSFAAEEATEALPVMTYAMPEYNIHPVTLQYDFGEDTSHPYIQDMTYVAYPQSKHFVLRPTGTGNFKLIKKVEVHGKHNDLNLTVENGNNHTYVAFTHLDAESTQEISLASVSITTAAIATGHIAMSASVNPKSLIGDRHTMSILMNQIPTQYLRLEPNKAALIKPAIDFDLFSHNEAEVQAAKFRTGVTFYTPNMLGATEFKKIRENGKDIVELGRSFNTQVFFIENGKKNMVAVFEGGAESSKLYDVSDHSEVTNVNAKFKCFKDHGLLDLDNLAKQKANTEVNAVILNLNDPVLNNHIEIMTISTNVVIYLPVSPRIRIGAILWNKHQMDIDEEANAIITVINNGVKNYLLVDSYYQKSSLIKRQLYHMEILPDSNRLRLVSQANCNCESGGLDAVHHLLSLSWYQLIAQALPLHADFQDVRVGKAEYSYHKLIMTYMPHGHNFTLGNLDVKGKKFETTDGHRWRQVHRQQENEENTQYYVYTMTPKGIEEIVIDKDGAVKTKETTNFRRVIIPKVSGSFTTLFVDDMEQGDVKSSVSKIGDVKVTVAKLEATSSGFNPIVFGKHEIVFSPNEKCCKVTISEQPNGLREITADVAKPQGETAVVTFRENAPGSGLFTVDKESTKLPFFVDTNEPINKIGMYFSRLDTLDFNKGHFPHYVRYLTLNKYSMYFTGSTMHTGLNISFGAFNITLPPADEGFHIWVRYQSPNVEIATLYMQYHTGDGTETTFYTIEDAKKAKAIRRPTEANCNWGPLSNLEFHLVNHTLLRHAYNVHELVGLEVNIDSGEFNPNVITMKVDAQTTLYTTLASSGTIIGDVVYKHTVIRGGQKEIVKHVYVSQAIKEDILLIVTRNIKGVDVQAYKFGSNNSFDTIELSAVPAQEHLALSQLISHLH